MKYITKLMSDWLNMPSISSATFCWLSPSIQQHVSGQTYCSSWKGLRHCRSTRLCSMQSSKHPPRTSKHAQWACGGVGGACCEGGQSQRRTQREELHDPPLGLRHARHFLSSGLPQQRCSVMWNLICSLAILTSHPHHLNTERKRESCAKTGWNGMENIPERLWSCKMKMEWPFEIAYNTWKMVTVFLPHFSVCLFTPVCVCAWLWGNKCKRVSKQS